MIRVLVVDDHELVRLSIAAVLAGAADIDVVGQCADGCEVAAAALQWQPDVVLMDLSMPVVDGIEATRRLLAILPATRVVVLTSVVAGGMVRRALDAGVVGYQLKTADPVGLIDAVHAAAAGERPFDARALEELRHQG